MGQWLQSSLRDSKLLVSGLPALRWRSRRGYYQTLRELRNGIARSYSHTWPIPFFSISVFDIGR